MTTQTLEFGSTALTLADRVATDLPGFAAGLGHPDFPCLSRAHNPSSCVPCTDFSPWLRERVRRGDVDAIGEYLWRIREANPGVGDVRGGVPPALPRPGGLHHGSAAGDVPASVATEEGYIDLRVALVLLAAHEGFSGFIMTGEAADFLAAAVCPHAYTLAGAERLVELRNDFVRRMASEMSYWSTWPPLSADTLHPIAPPQDPDSRSCWPCFAPLPLGVRAHAADVLRHLVADPSTPRTLASLSRYETRKRGLDVTDPPVSSWTRVWWFLQPS